jgi:hypothetical protein
MIMVWMKVIKYALIPISLLTAGVIYKKWPKLKQDNIVEEFVEDFLEEHTGFDIDLSPDSKEGNGNK